MLFLTSGGEKGHFDFAQCTIGEGRWPKYQLNPELHFRILPCLQDACLRMPACESIQAGIQAGSQAGVFPACIRQGTSLLACQLRAG